MSRGPFPRHGCAAHPAFRRARGGLINKPEPSGRSYGDEKASEKLSAGAIIFKALSEYADAAPEVFSDPGAPPEAIEPERDDRKQQSFKAEGQKLARFPVV